MIFGLIVGAILQRKFGTEETARIICIVVALEIFSHVLRGFMGWPR
jgi:hypothetical protein